VSDAPVPTIEITEPGPAPAIDLPRAVRAAFDRATAGDSALDPAVLEIDGMSGRKYRMFINNLIGSLPIARYLEVGSWAGSTLCAAIAGNKVTATAIDNWSQFGGPTKMFFTNLARFKGPDAKVSFLESDFRAVPWQHIGAHNVYLFDGPHGASDQCDGVAIALPALDARFVLVVDDWNWPSVREGTLKGIQNAGLRTELRIELRTTADNTHAPAPFVRQRSDWHNGYFIAVLAKA
jgi:Methyltransferase domain